MRRFATWITGHRKTVIIGWIVALIVAGMLAGAVGSDFSEEFKLPSSDSTEAYELLEHRFPAQSGETSLIVFKATEGVESAAVKQKMEGLFAKVAKFPHVTEVANPYQGGGAAAVSEDGKIAYATIQFDTQSNKLDKEKTKGIIADTEAVAGGGLQIELGGQPIQEAEEESGDASFFIGLLAAVVILLLTFGSVVAMGLPILTALFALGVGISLITIGTHVFDTANFAPVLAAMIGLGVGIDYALFILTRFRNALDEGLEPREAAIAAVDTAGRAVLFAGITVIISLMGMLLLGISFLYGVAVAAAIAVLFTMIAALTLLPALLPGPVAGSTSCGSPASARARPASTKTAGGSAGAAGSSGGRWSRRCSRAASCSCSACRCSRSVSASTTPAPTPRGRRRGRPTTCSPKASAPASTDR
jgi:RND superfamily putative drug exporter